MGALLVSGSVGALAAAPRAVPADGRIVMQDYGYRDWGPELVHFTVDPAKFATGKCVLKDAAGKEIPCQTDDGLLTFVAALAKGTTAEYVLTAGKPDAKASTLRSERGKGVLELGNALFAVQVPPPGEKTYKTAVAAGEVPPPILAWQAAGGPWMGAARAGASRTRPRRVPPADRRAGSSPRANRRC